MSLANFDIERGLARLQMMERIRAFERAARHAAIEDELVLGAIHLSIGQEAVATGVMEPRCARTITSRRHIAGTVIRWRKAPTPSP